VKAGLEWSLDLRTCVTLVARLASGLLYFLFDVAMRGLVALIALAIVVHLVPRASSGGATDLRSVTMALRARRHVPSGRHWMFPIEFHKHVLG
jgi:hypothetical protein